MDQSIIIAEYAEEYIKALIKSTNSQFSLNYIYKNVVDLRALSPYDVKKTVMIMEKEIMKSVNTINRSYTSNYGIEVMSVELKNIRDCLFDEIKNWCKLQCGNDSRLVELESDNCKLREEIKQMKEKFKGIMGLAEKNA